MVSLRVVLLTLVFGLAACSTTKPLDETDRDVRSHEDAFLKCYDESALYKNNEGSGDIKINVVVGEDGKVKSSSVKDSTLNDPEMEKCVLNVVNQIQFTKKSFEFNYPFRFHPE